jgi:hypothetical protein
MYYAGKHSVTPIIRSPVNRIVSYLDRKVVNQP